MHRFSLRISLDTHGGHACPVEGRDDIPLTILLYSLCPAEFSSYYEYLSCRIGLHAFPSVLKINAGLRQG